MFLSEAAVTAFPVTPRSARNRTGKLQRILSVFALKITNEDGKYITGEGLCYFSVYPKIMAIDMGL